MNIYIDVLGKFFWLLLFWLKNFCVVKNVFGEKYFLDMTFLVAEQLYKRTRVYVCVCVSVPNFCQAQPSFSLAEAELAL